MPTVPAPTELLAAALSYAKQGWYVFPCTVKGKTPLIPKAEGGHGQDDATVDEAQIRGWWGKWPNANIGIATEKSGLVVLDVDAQHDGEAGLDALQAKYSRLPATPTVITGGGGGHFYFKAPQEGLVHNSTSKLAPGVDIRGNGYVIAPPSIHPNGNPYRWELSSRPDNMDVALLPKWIWGGLQTKDGANTPRTEPIGDIIPEHERNSTLTSLGGTMRHRGMSQSEIAAALLVVNRERCQPPLPEEEVLTIAKSLARYAPAAQAAQSDLPSQPVDAPPLDALLDAVRSTIRRYVVLSDQQADAVTLWTAHTHAFAAVETTPYLSIRSAEKRSGKSRLLEVLENLVPKPLKTENISVAALVHLVDEGATLLLDEVDSVFGKGRPSDTQEMLRGILDSGYRKGGCYVRMVGQGAAMKPRQFSTFSPKALSGIGRLPGTLDDRSIIIDMKRKTKEEHTARFRHRSAREQAQPIRESLASWATLAIEHLRDAQPRIPPELDDRAADGWEPLLAIADMAGGDWPQRARDAALTLSSGENREDDSLGPRLLSDIRNAFNEREADKLASADLLKSLNALEESPWGGFGNGGMTVRELARMLKPYRVNPKQVRINDRTLKGYERESFREAWLRYAPLAGKHPKQTFSDTVGGDSLVGNKSGGEGPTFPLPEGAANSVDDPVVSHVSDKSGAPKWGEV